MVESYSLSLMAHQPIKIHLPYIERTRKSVTRRKYKTCIKRKARWDGLSHRLGTVELVPAPIHAASCLLPQCLVSQSEFPATFLRARPGSETASFHLPCQTLAPGTLGEVDSTCCPQGKTTLLADWGGGFESTAEPGEE